MAFIRPALLRIVPLFVLVLFGMPAFSHAQGWGNIGTVSETTAGYLCAYDPDGDGDANIDCNDLMPFVKSDGKVGIGTTNPQQKLHVAGSIATAGNLYTVEGAGRYFGSNLYYDDGWKYASTYDGAFLIRNSGDGIQFITAPGNASAAGDAATALEHMRILENGNVGIGTANPQTKLEVNGTISTTNIAVANELSTTSLYVNGTQITGGAGSSLVNGTSSITVADSGSITLDVAGTRVITFSENGRVGIRVPEPERSLHVGGDGMLLENAVPISWVDAGGTPRTAMYVNGSDILAIQNNTQADGGDIVFNTQTGGATSMRINSDGNVGIGTDTPVSALTVSGSISLINSTGIATLFNNAGEAVKFLAGDNAVALFTGGAERARVTSAGDIAIGSGVASARLDLASGDFKFIEFDRTSNVNVDSLFFAGVSYSATGDDFVFLGPTADDFVVTDDGNVGIATSDPQTKLEVNGTISTTALTVNGTAITGGAGSSLVNGTSSITVASGGAITLDTNGSNRMIVGSDGKVGIGTGSPTGTLHVYSAGTPSVRVSTLGVSENDQAIIELETDAANHKYWHWFARGNAYTNSGQQNDLGLTYYDGTAHNHVMHFDSVTQNVGIGTALPEFSLDVSGSVSFKTGLAGTVFQVLGEDDSTIFRLTAGGNITFGGGISRDVSDKVLAIGGGGAYNNGGNLNLYGASHATFPGLITFRQGTTERFRIDSDGNVGIGTASPVSALHVSGSLTLNNNQAYQSLDSGSTARSLMWLNGSDMLQINNAGGGTMFLNLGTEHMRINSTGNVGIATTNPQTELEVNGTISATALTVNGTAITGGVGSSLISGTSSIAVADSGSITISTNNVERLMLGKNGRVYFGDGDFSDKTNSRLQVKGSLAAWAAGASSPGQLLAASHDYYDVDGSSTWRGVGLSYYGADVSGTILPTVPLDKARRAALFATNVSGLAIGTNQNAAGDISFFSANGTLATLEGDTGDFGIGTDDPNAKLEVNGTISATALTVDGNVGIGTNDLSPSSGAAPKVIMSDASQLQTLRLESTSEVAGDTVGLAFALNADSRAKAGVVFEATGTFGKGKLHLINDVTNDNNDYALADAKLTINESGNVGIGTTDPSFPLYVSSTGHVAYFGKSSLLDQYISVRGGVGVMMGLDADLPDVNGSALIQSGANKGFGFAVNSGTFGGVAPSLFIKSDGNVGIGTTSPSAKFEVNSGHIKASGGGNLIFEGTSANAGDIVFQESDGNQKGRVWTSSDAGVEELYLSSGDTTPDITVDAAGYVGIGTTDPGYKLHVVGTAGLSTGTAWTNASDARLKDVHGTYDKGLKEILALQPIQFNYKQDNPLNLPSDKNIVGFVAQEVQKSIPEAVTEGEKGYLELNVDPIHWAAINAIKELKAENDTLKAQNEAILKRLEALEAGVQ